MIADQNTGHLTRQSGDDELFRACQAILADRGAWRIWYPPEVQKS